MRAILADTGPLYAVAVPSDQHHLQAIEDSERLSQTGIEVLIPYPILLETHSLMLRRATPQATQLWLVEMMRSASLVNLTADDFLQAASLILRYTDQPLSLFDGILAVLSDRLGIPVWSYDHHFDILRFDILRVERWR